MSVRDSIGLALANAKLAVAREVGVDITFTHKKNVPADLKAVVVTESYDVEDQHLGVLAEVGDMVLDIPVQDGLDPITDGVRPIADGDTILYNDLTFYVSGQVTLRARGYVFRVVCKSERPSVHGVRA